MKRNSWRIYGDSSYVTGRRFGSRLGYARPAVDALIQGILAYNPIAYWPLNDPVGSSTARDVTGNGYNFTAVSVNFGSAGLTNYGETSVGAAYPGLFNPQVPLGEAFSVMYLTNFADSAYSYQASAPADSSPYNFFIQQLGTPRIRAGATTGSGAYNSLPINTTGLVTFTYANQTGNLWINTTGAAAAMDFVTTKGLALYESNTVSNTRYAHAAVFDKALTQGEIAAIYQLITATPTHVPFNGTDGSVGVLNPSNLAVIMGAGATQGGCFWVQDNLPGNATRVSNGAGLIVNGEMLIVADGTYGVMPLPPQSRLVPLGDGVYPPAQNNTCFLRVT